MIISLLQEGISEITQLFLKRSLKKWWDSLRIDRQIARVIKDTCKDEGFDFDEFLNRLGVNDSKIKERLKSLKKSFKKIKTYASTEEFIDNVIETYLDLFFKAEGSVIQNNPINSEEVALIEKIKKNIQVHLLNFKPVETIASINIQLKEIEAHNKNRYDSLMKELQKLSSKNDLLPENLNLLRSEVDNAFNQILKEIKLISKGTKLKDTISFNDSIEIKMAFIGAQNKVGNKIGVGKKYSIKIQVDSKIAFEVKRIEVNFEPLGATFLGNQRNYDSIEGDFYVFSISEGIKCNVGRTFVGSIDMKSPKPNHMYQLYVRVEGQVKEDDVVYLIEKSRGPFSIEREGAVDMIGQVLVGLVDKFLDPEFSENLKKLKDEGEDKYI